MEPVMCMPDNRQLILEMPLVRMELPQYLQMFIVVPFPPLVWLSSLEISLEYINLDDEMVYVDQRTGGTFPQTYTVEIVKPYNKLC